MTFDEEAKLHPCWCGKVAVVIITRWATSNRIVGLCADHREISETKIVRPANYGPE
jgi:hypothetical protein